MRVAKLKQRPELKSDRGDYWLKKKGSFTPISILRAHLQDFIFPESYLPSNESLISGRV